MTKLGPTDLEEARELLRRTRVFARGESGGVTADMLWDALLSLENAAELVAVATRLEWQFHPRGFDNVDLHRRYGDGILPWLATRLDDDGVLHNQPWCVVPCLLACGSPEALALAFRVRAIQGRTAWGGCGDGDLVRAWCERHPEVARAELERLARFDARPRAYLAGLWPETRGGRSADSILALLDACAAGLVATRVSLWPSSDHALRAVAARQGDDWGLALERVDGTRPRGLMAARVAMVAFGSRVNGVVAGAAIASRPLAAFDADDLDARLGPPELALPALGLAGAGTVVASIPHLAFAARASASPVFIKLAELLAS